MKKIRQLVWNVRLPALVIGMVAMLMNCSCQDASTQPTCSPVPRKIVVMGSSTAGGSAVTKNEYAYANRLKAWLQSKSSAWDMRNLGYGGLTTGNIRSYDDVVSDAFSTQRIDSIRNIDAALAYKPALVVLHLVSNDVESGLPLEESKSLYLSLIRRAQASGAKVLVVESHPRPFARQGLTDTLLMWRDFLRSQTAAEFVPLWDSVALDSVHLKPELIASWNKTHMTDTGHAIIARQILRSRTWGQVFADSAAPATTCGN